MSEEESDKTEEPSSRRIDKARSEGNVPFSQDISNWTSLFAAFIVISLTAPYLLIQLKNILARFFDLVYDVPLDRVDISNFLFLQIVDVIKILCIPLLFFFIIGIMQKIAQNGITWSTKPFELKLEKLSILKGLKKYTGLKQYIEFLKNIIKLLIISGITYVILTPEIHKLIVLPSIEIIDVMKILQIILVKMLASVLAGYLVISIADFLYQRYTYHQQLRMTKKEVKEEYKETEGDPQIKSRIRQMRIEKMRYILTKIIPQATVIITNPSHYAIALIYTSNMPAPKVIAKGKDSIALKIREIATEHRIPIVENRILAQALYSETNIEEYIPYRFFQAVAEIISFVMHQKSRLFN